MRRASTPPTPHPLATPSHTAWRADGTTYDTAAVRKAAAALLAGGAGGTLRFPAQVGGKPATYLTGAFNVSSHTYVDIEAGATVLGSTRGEDWPLLTAAVVWPQFGHGSDCVPGQESCRLMHQALLFSWGSTNVTLGGGGTFDCNSQKETWWKCARTLSEPPCNGYGRPHCMMFSNATDVEVSDLHGARPLQSPWWDIHLLVGILLSPRWRIALTHSLVLACARVWPGR